MKETDESRNQRFQDAATIHNLILVSVSPRRSIVVRVDHSAGWRATPLNGSGYCLRQGHVVFGPASYSDCHDYLSVNAAPVRYDLDTKE